MRFTTALATLTLLTTPAVAQTIELGSDDLITQTVERAGYDSVRITQRQLTIVRTEACKGNTKYRVKVSILGKITSEEARGRCDLRPTREVRPRRDVPPTVDAAQLPGLLRAQGYRRIKIIDNELPRYVAQACQDGARYTLIINRRGRIAERERLGDCRQRIDAAALPDILAERGFDRVRVLRGNRAPYLAEGCRNNNLVEVRVDRFGEIIKRDRIGRCEAALSVDDVKATLEKSGLMRVSVYQRDRGFTAEVCRDAERYQLTIGGRGNVRDERRIGQCASQSVLNVLQTLETRGANDTNAFVEGCFKGNRFRWSFNRLGERTGREQVGRC